MNNQNPTPKSKIRNPKWLLLVALGLTLALYLPTLGYGWAADDFNFAVPKGGAQVVNFFNLGRGGGFYRPITWLSFVLDYNLWGWFNPAAWRLENVVINLACCALLWRLLSPSPIPPPAGRGETDDAPDSPPPSRGGEWGRGGWVAGVAAIIFAVLPAHPGAITWVDGRFDSLTALFYISSVVCFVAFLQQPHKWWLWSFTGLFLLLSLLTKEMGLTVFAVLILADLLLFPQPELRARRWGAWLWAKLRLHGLFILLGGGYLLLRLYLQANRVLLMGYGSTPRLDQSLLDNLAGYFGMLIGLPTIAPLKGDAANLFLLGFGVAALLLAWLGGRLGWFGLGWLLVSLAPVASIAAFDQASRYVYIPSFGLAILVGAAVANFGLRLVDFGRKLQSVRIALAALPLAVLVALGAWGTWLHNEEWRVAGDNTRSVLAQLKATYPNIEPSDRMFYLGLVQTHRRASVWNEGSLWATRMNYAAPDRVDAYRQMMVYSFEYQPGNFRAAIQQPNPTGGRDYYLRWQEGSLRMSSQAELRQLTRP